MKKIIIPLLLLLLPLVAVSQEDKITEQYLIMECNAPDALVFFDNQSVSEKFIKQKLQKLLSVGNHTYRVEAPMYHFSEGTVTIAPEKTNRLTVSLLPAFATITLIAPNPNDSILINGQFKATLNWTGTLTPGTYQIETRRASHTPAIKSYEVKEGQDETLQLEAPEPIYGKLNVSCSEIDADIYIDGTKVGVTPTILTNVLIGERMVELRKEGYIDATRTVSITQRKMEALNITLETDKFPDDTPEVKKCRKAAMAGDAEAQFQLGSCYYLGFGVPQSHETAVEWFRKAAEQGYVKAQYNLGYCYYEGEGVPQSFETAVEWFRKAAEQGDAFAQCRLGDCYYNGEGVAKSYETAVSWYRKAAEQGNAEAQCNLGVCYSSGRGVPQSYKTAAEWCRKAAEQGLAEAQHNLGICYEYGEGVPQSYENAAEWYRKAAEQGDAEAIEFLEEMGYDE